MISSSTMTAMSDCGSVRLRFGLGDRVLAKVGEGDMQPGEIAGAFVRDASMSEGYCAAYAIRLGNGRVVYAWKDLDAYCALAMRAHLTHAHTHTHTLTNQMTLN